MISVMFSLFARRCFLSAWISAPPSDCDRFFLLAGESAMLSDNVVESPFAAPADPDIAPLIEARDDALRRGLNPVRAGDCDMLGPVSV